ncbi:MAG: CCA tRNA nucleotidyltransferase [Spirochaetaceae bacterium]|jgi:tRNA nucleotidyltransferase/poly(A) polymerase|nr:CCA tRNA nucleotidyltransferase [Spirochaetaceae bacterium]
MCRINLEKSNKYKNAASASSETETKNLGRPSKIPVPQWLKEFSDVFSNDGKQVYLVGGAVRDAVMGERASDYDAATDAKPECVKRLFKRVVPTGIKHGTVTVYFKGRKIEVTTFRAESDYKDGRRPQKIEFAPSIEEDLSRRDFTMNAIAALLPQGLLVDPFNGVNDIKSRIIRCVGGSAERFSEDGLRPLRAVRFCASLGFTPDRSALDAIPKSLHITAKVSAERVKDELVKTLMCEKPLAALQIMEKTGLLGLILPEIAALRGVPQNGFHSFDALDHSFYALEWACLQNHPLTVRLAALFHDCGKKECAILNENGLWTFYNHEKTSERITRSALLRLRFPNALIEETAALVKEHMFNYESRWSDGAVRRFIARVGEKNINALFRLRLCDVYGFNRDPPEAGLLSEFEGRIKTALTAHCPLSLKDLALKGSDLIEAGFSEGPEIGAALNALLQKVIEDPLLNEREKLLKAASSFKTAPPL